MHLTSVSYFRSPGGRDNGGRVIPTDQHEVEFLVAGRGFFDLDGGVVEVGCGHVLWHQSHDTTLHRIHPRDPYHCVVLIFATGRRQARPLPRLTCWRDPAAAREFALEALRHFHRGDLDGDLLSAWVFATLRLQAELANRSGHRPVLPRPLARAQAHLDRAYADDLTIADLARAAGCSSAHLHDLFQRHFGTTPARALRARRLRAARHRLVSSEESVAAVGRACGFTDAGSFGRAFRREVGLSPGRYRRSYTVDAAGGQG